MRLRDTADIPNYMNDFLNYMEIVKGKSPQTVQEYYYDLRVFLRYMKFYKSGKIKDYDKKEKINDLSVEFLRTIELSDLYSYMSWLSSNNRNAAAARSRKTASIRSFFKYLCDKAGIIDINPAFQLESPKLTKRLPRYLNIEESIQLLDSVDGSNKERDFAIITLFLNCGIRLSELVNIDIKNIKDDKLTVIGKGDKERTIYFNDACMDAVKEYMKVRPQIDTEALFLSKRKSRISKNTVQYIVKKFISLSGLDPKRYSVHKLRHTAATLMHKYGKVDIRALQEILGHESISTTEIYTHVDNSQIKQAITDNPLSGYQRKN